MEQIKTDMTSRLGGIVPRWLSLKPTNRKRLEEMPAAVSKAATYHLE